MPKHLLLAALLTVPSAPVLAQSAVPTNQPTPEQAAQVIERLFGSMYGPGADT